MQTGTIHPNHRFRIGLIFALPVAGCLVLLLGLFSTVQANITAPAPLSTWFVDMQHYSGAAHGSLKCEECHGSMLGDKALSSRKKVHPDPKAEDFLKTRTRRTFDYQSCKKCHKTAHERFQEGEHAKAAAKEKTDGKPSDTGFAPTCGDCHSAHYARSHHSREMIGKEMTQTCGTCHPDQQKSYLANYHGKAGVNLGYEKAAFCTDCHGAHTTVSLKDDALVLATCKRCHPDATAKFANIIIHDSRTRLDQKNQAKQAGLKWVAWLGALSLFFVVAVLVFFYMHSGLLMLRKLHEKLRRHK